MGSNQLPQLPLPLVLDDTEEADRVASLWLESVAQLHRYTSEAPLGINHPIFDSRKKSKGMHLFVLLL